jgi:hypothetical protein
VSKFFVRWKEATDGNACGDQLDVACRTAVHHPPKAARGRAVAHARASVASGFSKSDPPLPACFERDLAPVLYCCIAPWLAWHPPEILVIAPVPSRPAGYSILLACACTVSACIL